MMHTPALPFLETFAARCGVRWRLRLRWSLACVPPTVTDQQKGARVLPGGRIHFYTKARVAQGRREWAAILRGAREAFGRCIPDPVPVKVSLMIVYPWPKSTRESERMWYVPMTTYPDRDNIEKAIFDVMAGRWGYGLGFFEDDKQVAAGQVSKWRGPEPGVRLSIWEGKVP